MQREIAAHYAHLAASAGCVTVRICYFPDLHPPHSCGTKLQGKTPICFHCWGLFNGCLCDGGHTWALFIQLRFTDQFGRKFVQPRGHNEG